MAVNNRINTGVSKLKSLKLVFLLRQIRMFLIHFQLDIANYYTLSKASKFAVKALKDGSDYE